MSHIAREQQDLKFRTFDGGRRAGDRFGRLTGRMSRHAGVAGLWVRDLEG